MTVYAEAADIVNNMKEPVKHIYVIYYITYIW